jgi:eukaryotic-like serine/threonine-protein kinase
MMNIRINKVAAVIIGVVVLLALSVGATLLVTNHISAHNLAVQRAAATASHNRAVARASAAANAKAIADANAEASRAEAAAKAAGKAARDAKKAAGKPAPAPVAVVPGQQPAVQPGSDPFSVVQSYFYDLSTPQDLGAAWSLLGPSEQASLGGYAVWAAARSDIVSETASEISENGDQVSVALSQTRADGATTSSTATFTVDGGVITGVG